MDLEEAGSLRYANRRMEALRMTDIAKSIEAAGLQGKAHNGSRTTALVEARNDSRNRTERTTSTG